MQERRTNRDRTAGTQAALLKAARELIVARGYARTGTNDIVEAAGVTRGALYHHFADKAGLMRRLLADEARAVAAHIDAATRDIRDAREGLALGTDAYFAAMKVPGRARLLLSEAVAALGHEEAAAINRAAGKNELATGLAAALESAGGDPAPAGVLAELLSAAFDRAALMIANGADEAACVEAMHAVVAGVAGGVARPPR